MRKIRAPGTSTYLAHRRWTEDHAREALAALAQSGLSLSAFALRERLDPQRLARWRRRLGGATAPIFEEVVRHQVVGALAGDAKSKGAREQFEIVLVSGRVVRVPESFDESALRRLLAVADEAFSC